VRKAAFDEAHHAIARTYQSALKKIIGDRKLPLVGLTATPGRGIDPDGSETRKLAKLFDANLLTPKWFGDNPFKKLTDAGVLSTVTWKVKETGKIVELKTDEKRYLEKFKLFSPYLLERLGSMKDRNNLIRLAVTQDTKKLPTLVFACSVAHAEQLAVMWRRCSLPIKAQAITAETHITDRRRWIKEFKEGEIQVLVNYGVLTTGFDAPNVRRIIAARPTTSPVLFEQMIGRGLRGPKFGGTANCIIVDIADQFEFHGSLKGFGRWERDWLGGKRP
jgi:superfamily II DNA or RNA helicase